MDLIINCFERVGQMSIVATLIGLTIVLVRKLLGKKISSKILYIMWAVFLVSLIVPPFIASKTSVYNYIELDEISSENIIYKKAETTENVELPKENLESDLQSDNLQKAQKDIEAFDFSNLNAILSCIWLLGILTFLCIYVASNIIFKIKIGKDEFQEKRVENIFNRVKENLKIKRNIKLITQKNIATPAIIGVLKPQILLSENLKDYSDLEIEYIFRHELAHYKRKDNVINCILIILRTIHWFNPIIWYVIKEIRKDMEFIADEIAVKGLPKDEKKEYCKLLVNLASNAKPTFMEKAIGITDDKNNLEKRIDMIKLSDKISKHPIFASALVFVIIGLICLVLYTNNYYLPELETPPELYLKDTQGRITPMVLVQYDWLYKNEFKNYDAKFNNETFEFKEENTLYAMVQDMDIAGAYEYTAFTEPKYRMSYLRARAYTRYKGTENYYSTGLENVFGANGTESNEIFFTGDIIKIIVHFPNNSRATYVAKCVGFAGCEERIFSQYKDVKITDENKILSLVKELAMKGNIESVKTEGDTLYVNCLYGQKPQIYYDMSLVLFTCIPDLEKVVVSTNHKKVADYIDDNGEQVEFSTEPLEITKEIVNMNASRTIEELQAILNER